VNLIASEHPRQLFPDLRSFRVRFLAVVLLQGVDFLSSPPLEPCLKLLVSDRLGAQMVESVMFDGQAEGLTQIPGFVTDSNPGSLKLSVTFASVIENSEVSENRLRMFDVAVPFS
jgi:hypothetical protein